MATQENVAVIRRFAEEVITQGDLDSAARFVWEDVVEQVSFFGPGPWVEGVERYSWLDANCIPDLDFSIHEQIAEAIR